MTQNFDDFETAIAPDALERLIDVGRRFGFDPLASIDMESFFLHHLETLSLYEVESRIVPAHFVSVDVPPKWLQGCEWPFSSGRPMLFLGQLNVKENEFIPGETAVFAFYDRETMSIITVIQRVGYVP